MNKSLLCKMLGLVAVRRRFTKLRLVIGMLAAWALVAGGTMGVLHIAMDMPLDLEDTLMVITPALSYLVVYFLYVSFNQWCRRGTIRAWGLNQDALPAES